MIVDIRIIKRVDIVRLVERRHAFSSASVDSLARPPRIMSRRVWLEYTKNQPKNSKASADKKSSASSTPWPKSVVYTGYALAGTLIPYITLWIVVANPATRDALLSEDLRENNSWIRRHFGEFDADSISFVDYMQSKDDLPPKHYVLPSEDSWKIRYQQKLLQTTLLDADIKTRITVLTEENVEGDISSSIQETVTLPGSTVARRDNLLKTIGIDPSPNVSVAVDFPYSSNADEESVEVDISLASDEFATPAHDPLVKGTQIYSLWHYQSESSAGAAAASPSLTEEEVAKSRLEYEIAQLQTELTAGTRSIDDVMEELKRKQRELRKLQWKKWVPWS